MDEMIEGTPLEGGVASDVRVVVTPDGPIVIKKALAKLKVAADWYSDPARSLIEVAAIEAFAAIGPKDTVPEIVWVRPEQNMFAMRLVDPRLRNWKVDLLAGRVDPDTAHRAGEIIGSFHTASQGRADIAEQFDDLRFFRELRIEPFFDHVAAQRPELAGRISHVATAMLNRRETLVHGDFSPKNLLADGRDIVVLDFEVTHWGDPRFDVAFCLAHLMLKSALLDRDAGPMYGAIEAFLEGYRQVGPAVVDASLAHITACLLLARLFGKSPVDYLGRIDVSAVERKAIDLLIADRSPEKSDFLLSAEQHL